jgi:hypothetical protein
MTSYITLRLPEGKVLKLLFVRMTEDDPWVCQIDSEFMNSVQNVIGQGFYGSI